MKAHTLIENLVSKIFKRNKAPAEIKVLAIALFLQGMGVRRIGKIVSRAKSSVHEWTLKFREALNYRAERKERKRIAVDETKTWYFVYAAVDADTGELICMKAYTARNYLITLDFIKRVLKYCADRKDVEIITDKMPCYKRVCDRLGIRYKHETFGKRNCVEQVFRSFKFFTARFNNCLCVNLRKVLLKMDKSYWFKRVLYLLELWCKQFVFYWNVVKGGEAY